MHHLSSCLNTSCIAALCFAAGGVFAQVSPERLYPQYPYLGEMDLNPLHDPPEYDAVMGGYTAGASGSEYKGRWETLGTSVAFGDFDGDDHSDIAVAGQFGMNLRDACPRTGAGLVFILYGPSTDWPKKFGVHSDGASGLSGEGWFNVFDIGSLTGRRHQSDANSPPQSDIAGALLFGRYGRRFASDVAGSVVVDPFNTTSNPMSYDGVSPQEPMNGLYWDIVGLNWNVVEGEDCPVFDPQNPCQLASGCTIDCKGDLAGYSLSCAGDVDGDGCDDLLIGAPDYDVDEYITASPDEFGFPAASAPVLFQSNAAGCVYLVFGQERDEENSIVGLQGEHELEDLVACGLAVKFVGATLHDKIGQDVRNASLEMGQEEVLDVNKDGYADFVIGAQSVDIGDRDEYAGIELLNVAGNAPIAGDPGYRDNGPGACFLIYGREDWSGATDNTFVLPDDIIDSSGLLDDCAAIFGSSHYSYLAYAGFAGDFDGNGCADVVLGAPNVDYPGKPWSRSNVGAAYILFGYEGSNAPKGRYYTSDFAATGSLSSRQAMWKETVSEPECSPVDPMDPQFVNKPVSIRILGSVNTIADYRPDPMGDALTQSEFDDMNMASNGFGSELGWTVMSAGDVDGDGKFDVLLGAPDFKVGQTSVDSGVNATWGSVTEWDSRGKAYLIYGFDPYCDLDDDEIAIYSPTSHKYDIEVDKLLTSGPTGSAQACVFRGARNGDNAGWHVFCAGDINKDGYGDFLIGANEADRAVVDGSETHVYQTVGAIYVIYGRHRAHLSGERDLATIGTNSLLGAVFFGDHLWSTGMSPTESDTAGDIHRYSVGSVSTLAGTWVAGGGDIDGDGYLDALVGVPNLTRPNDNYPTSSNSYKDMGGAFIIYGGNILIDGDINSDGFVTATDLALYEIQVANSTAVDLTHDGVVDQDDIDYLESFIP